MRHQRATGSNRLSLYVYPAISAVVARWFTGCGYSNAGLTLGKLRWYVYGWSVSLAMCVFVFSAEWVIGAAKFDLSLERLAALGPTDSAPVEPPEGFTKQQFVLVLAMANLTVMNIPGILLGFGKEFGWQGYLFPSLLLLGRIRAFVVVGFVWWAWHLLLAFIQPAQDQTTLAVVSTHLFGLLGAIFYGVVLVWIRYASGSIFPVALAHISFNNVTAAGVILMDLNPSTQPLLNTTAAALVGALLWKFKAWQVVPHRDYSERLDTSIDDD